LLEGVTEFRKAVILTAMVYYSRLKLAREDRDKEQSPGEAKGKLPAVISCRDLQTVFNPPAVMLGIYEKCCQ
jgi:hypothetical protein